MLGTEGTRSAADEPKYRLVQTTGTPPGRSSFTKLMRPTSCTMIFEDRRTLMISVASTRSSMNDDWSGSRYRTVTKVVVEQWHCPSLLEHNCGTENVTANAKVNPQAASAGDATSIL